VRPWKDLISDTIKSRQRWSECDELVNMWQHSTPSVGPHGRGIFVDIGANIGACSLAMLQMTNATVLAVEPSPANLFFLTSSLRAAAAVQPDIARRVAVLPFALGNTTGHSEITASVDNAGDSMIGSASTFASSRRRAGGKSFGSGTVGGRPGQTMPIAMTTLDKALASPSHLASRISHLASPSHLASHQDGVLSIRLMKLDAQGFECRVLDGMRQLLERGQVHALKTEVSRRHLQAQGCSESELLERLRRSFHVVRSEDVRHHKHKKRLKEVKGQYEVVAFAPRFSTPES
jgi:FkbM family methyltransferase